MHRKNPLCRGNSWLASLILTHSLDKQVPALTEFPPEDRPDNVFAVFWSFRVMVGFGMLMLLAAALSLWLRYQGVYMIPGLSSALCYGWHRPGLSRFSRAGL